MVVEELKQVGGLRVGVQWQRLLVQTDPLGVELGLARLPGR